MKIKSLSFSSYDREWQIETVNFKELNLLVGVSGVGKTRILQALDLICDVAKDTERKLGGVNWSIEFSHLSKDYKWELETSKSSDETFELNLNNEAFEPGKAEIRYERLAEYKDGQWTKIVSRSATESSLHEKELPKLKKTESVITLLAEEDSIAPISKAFKRFIFNETPQRAIVSVPFDPSDISLSREESKEGRTSEIDRFKESAVDAPTVFKGFFMQKFFPSLFEEVKETYSEIFPNVEDIRISVDQEFGNQYQLLLEIKEEYSESWVKQTQISSGMYRTLTCLIEVMSAPDGSVIAIDEFENSLGINCMSGLTEFILDKSPDIQFILTSHHPYIINNIPWESWQVVSRDAGSIKVKPATEIPDLDTASNLDKFTQLIDLLEY
jgi:predicted ATPase